MNEILKAAISALIETVFQIVTGPGSHDYKAERLKRATAALTSETAAEALIRKALER
jgi:hypothetical protein